MKRIFSLIKDGKILLKCKIHPQAKKNSLQEIMQDGTFKISLTAVPEDGKANDALVQFISRETGIPKKNISILAWHTSRMKTVQLIC
jgi:uncharacterized protein